MTAPGDPVDVETELWRGYSGTANRKGRQQTNRAYRHRATSRLYRREPVSDQLGRQVRMLCRPRGSSPGSIAVRLLVVAFVIARAAA